MKGTKKKINIKNDKLINNYKLEYFKWFSTLFFSILTYVILANIIIENYKPNLREVIDLAKKLSISYSPQTFLPEPKEKLLYITAIFVFTFSLSCFYYIINKHIRNIKGEKIINLLYYSSLTISLITIVLLTYKGLVAENPFAKNIQNSHDTIAKTNADFYFISTFIYNNFYLYLFIIFPAILLGFLYVYKLSDKVLKRLNNINNIFVFGFCIILIIVSLLITSFKFPYTFENKYDFNSVYYSVIQVFYGQPLLVDNFTNTYGLYPHFVVPILKITGLSILNFSIIMSLLVALCFLLLLLFLIKTVDNKVLILLGFTTVFFNSYIYSKIIVNFDSYFAITPIRWILIFSLIYYSVIYLKNKSKILYQISFILFSVGILWNPEFGLIVFLSLIIFYCYQEIESYNLIKIIKRIIFHIIIAITCIAVTIILYMLIIKIFYGSYPEIGKMFSTMKVFSILGSGMLPMPSTYHPWMLIALIYIIGLMYCIYNIFHKNISSHSSKILLLTVLGIGCFSYYQGRSHNWNLLITNPIAFILLTIYADDLYKIIRKQKIFIIPFGIIIFILSFSFFQTIYDYKNITELINETNNKEKNYSENKQIEENSNFIKQFTTEKENVLILSPICFQGYYYALSKTKAAINPGLEDMFLKTDYNRIIDFLIRNKDCKVFLEAAGFTYYDLQIPQILRNYYKVNATNGDMIYFSKITEIKEGQNFFLKDDNSTIFHEDLLNNTEKSFQYSEGKKGKLKLNKNFSIEIIFKPIKTVKSSITNWATVLSNVKDSTGLVIQQNDTINNQYIFALPRDGVICPIIPNKWNYISFDVYNKIIRTFANGKLISIQSVKYDYTNNDNNLYIGNYNNLAGFFFGEIKEIRISHNMLNEKDIINIWNRVQKELK